MINEEATIYIVDDDSSVRSSTARLLRAASYHVESFSSAEEFIDLECYKYPCCLILDVKMPGLSGLELQEKIISSEIGIPIIFITGHASVHLSVRAMKGGAVNYLEKPFDQDEMLEEITAAIKLSIQVAKEKSEISAIKQCIDSLTPRENEVYNLVVTGKLNKQIAAELGVCEKTIKVHRARVMQKMQVRTLAELVHLSDRMSITTINTQYLRV